MLPLVLHLLSSISGETPVPTKGTKAVIEVDESGNKKFKSDQWGATLQGKNGNDATILVSLKIRGSIDHRTHNDPDKSSRRNSHPDRGPNQQPLNFKLRSPFHLRTTEK